MEFIQHVSEYKNLPPQRGLPQGIATAINHMARGAVLSASLMGVPNGFAAEAQAQEQSETDKQNLSNAKLIELLGHEDYQLRELAYLNLLSRYMGFITDKKRPLTEEEWAQLNPDLYENGDTEIRLRLERLCVILQMEEANLPITMSILRMTEAEIGQQSTATIDEFLKFLAKKTRNTIDSSHMSDTLATSRVGDIGKLNHLEFWRVLQELQNDQGERIRVNSSHDGKVYVDRQSVLPDSLLCNRDVLLFELLPYSNGNQHPRIKIYIEPRAEILEWHILAVRPEGVDVQHRQSSLGSKQIDIATPSTFSPLYDLQIDFVAVVHPYLNSSVTRTIETTLSFQRYAYAVKKYTSSSTRGHAVPAYLLRSSRALAIWSSRSPVGTY